MPKPTDVGQRSLYSKLEVGIDFCISLVINLSLQAIFVQTFTLSRGLTFSAVFLGLALARRYLTRRGFNRLVRGNQGQSVRMSAVEVWSDTVLGMLIAWGLATLWYPEEPFIRISGLVLASYAVAMVRRFAMRRLFEWLHRRQARLAS